MTCLGALIKANNEKNSDFIEYSFGLIKNLYEFTVSNNNACSSVFDLLIDISEVCSDAVLDFKESWEMFDALIDIGLGGVKSKEMTECLLYNLIKFVRGDNEEEEE